MTAQPVALPAPAEVRHIALLSGSGEDITDDDSIAEVMAVLDRENLDWEWPWDTFPTPRWTFSLVLPDGSRDQVSRLGPNWLGTGGESGAQLTRVDDQTLKALIELLNLSGL